MLWLPLVAIPLLWASALGYAPIRLAAQHEKRTDHSDCFIVKLKSNATMGREHQLFNVTPGHSGQVWNTALRGFFRCNISATALQRIASDPDVESISEDTVYKKTTTEVDAPWNLQRIDQRALPLLGDYNYTAKGQGVYLYIVDTGLSNVTTDFVGRIQPGISFVNDGEGTNDCDGHGTHVSGIAVGTVYGVAKGAFVVPVRTMDCTGTGANSAIISGIEWAVQQYQAGMSPGIINLSLGGPLDYDLNAAVAAAVQAGVPVTVAAGNSDVDACTVSPASEPSAITVSATNITDGRASYANVGVCVKLFAPGDTITSDWITGPDSTAVLSGTSMSAPHVAGAIALYFNVNPNASPAQVLSWLQSAATPGLVVDAGTGTPNALLYVGNGSQLPGAGNGGTGGGPPIAPGPSTNSSSVCFDLVTAPLSGGGVGWSIGQDSAELTAQPMTTGPASVTACLPPGSYTLEVDVEGQGGALAALQSGTMLFSLNPGVSAMYELEVQSAATPEGTYATGSKAVSATWMQDVGSRGGGGGLSFTWLPYGWFGLIIVLPFVGFVAWRFIPRRTPKQTQTPQLVGVAVTGVPVAANAAGGAAYRV
eukprot:TRINITY_DN365_c0_g1_i1.p1 TRINITY_DN365_c0_g1~~TRINITY_DN365_c0_g1_i1.p1  ORF type:complete len:594 (+),score=132.17 TRINITY_DN365_c0_g1_i1:31-1812(+)